jgi:hypothetical protein
MPPDHRAASRSAEEAQAIRQAVEDLLRRVEALEAAAAARERQQIQMPLDLASTRIVKDALIRTGFAFP